MSFYKPTDADAIEIQAADAAVLPTLPTLPALGTIVLFTLPSAVKRPAIVTNVRPAIAADRDRNRDYVPASVDLFVFTSPADGEGFYAGIQVSKVVADASADEKFPTVNTFKTLP